jgi:hypothetical protein
MAVTQLEAFTITLFVEAVVAFVVAPGFRAKPWRAALAAVLGSALTHPILWHFANALHAQLGRLTIPSLEALVVLAESIAYRGLATKRWAVALMLSFLVNLASWLVGEIIYALG